MLLYPSYLAAMLNNKKDTLFPLLDQPEPVSFVSNDEKRLPIVATPVSDRYKHTYERALSDFESYSFRHSYFLFTESWPSWLRLCQSAIASIHSHMSHEHRCFFPPSSTYANSSLVLASPAPQESVVRPLQKRPLQKRPLQHGDDLLAGDKPFDHYSSPFVPAKESGTHKKRNTRASQACESCRQRKVKCDETRPCKSCQENGTGCIYSDPAPKVKTSPCAGQGVVVNLLAAPSFVITIVKTVALSAPKSLSSAQQTIHRALCAAASRGDVLVFDESTICPGPLRSGDPYFR
ncbi:Uncharacterized protein HZ326_22824 [Fusarium oxysporum f. sp. albedinis]|nr:Uncharacterized protein HZ326_22824 [Fusarium oxysporum f. sp. albedinis]